MNFSRGILALYGAVIIGGAFLAFVYAVDEPLAKGVVIPRVECAGDPGQSYALYVPSNYDPERKWPVVYAFDPGARGSAPVSLAKDAAEKLGYIVTGSNNSQNGPSKPELEAANAIWKDSHRRFTIDDRRVYFAGFSGGARLAVSMALTCGDCAAGVISSGAGFPVDQPPSAQTHFDYFATIGAPDFNYPEVVELSRRLDQLGLPHRLRRFEGSHEWAPAEIWTEALAWMNLMAMKEGRLARNPAFISQQFDSETQYAQELEKRGDVHTAWQEYRDLARDFAGLQDVAPITKRAEELNDSPAVHEAEKQEKKDFAEQERLAGPIESGMTGLREGGGSRNDIRMQLLGQITELRDAEEGERKEDRRRVLRRALGQVVVSTYESAEARMRAGDFALASIYFELAGEALPKQPWPFIGIARAEAQLGHKKEALQALRRARENSSNTASLAAILENNGEFARYRNDPDFRKLFEDSSVKH